MLESDYLSQFTRLIQSVPWDIELPSQWRDFFELTGPVPAMPGDERAHARFRLRAYGLIYFDSPLPILSRPREPIGIYTSDFSRQGCGFLCDMQLFPEEEVRIVLPTFWTTLRIARARRITKRCYEIGARLLTRHDPSPEAFVMPDVAATPGR